METVPDPELVKVVPANRVATLAVSLPLIETLPLVTVVVVDPSKNTPSPPTPALPEIEVFPDTVRVPANSTAWLELVMPVIESVAALELLTVSVPAKSTPWAEVEVPFTVRVPLESISALPPWKLIPPQLPQLPESVTLPAVVRLAFD